MSKKSDWDAWIELQQSDFYVSDIVYQYPTYMKNAVILALTVAKWHPRNENLGHGVCAACETSCSCAQCFAKEICSNHNSGLYFRYFQTSNKKEKSKIAYQIYSILRKKYDKELKKIEQWKVIAIYDEEN